MLWTEAHRGSLTLCLPQKQWFNIHKFSVWGNFIEFKYCEYSMRTLMHFFLNGNINTEFENSVNAKFLFLLLHRWQIWGNYKRSKSGFGVMLLMLMKRWLVSALGSCPSHFIFFSNSMDLVHERKATSLIHQKMITHDKVGNQL